VSFAVPKGFWWGTATAAHQVEGGNVYNDNWLLEHMPESFFAEASGDAIDHYHRYEDDIALLADLGLNLYRFSLEWSRIEPEEGRFSTAALDHYRRMLAACWERGITPMVTFHHFTSPRWLHRHGGWAGDATPDRFARFCERATRHLGDLIGAACTLNELNIAAILAANVDYSFGNPWEFPMVVDAARELGVNPEQFVPFFFATSEKAAEVMLKSHRLAVTALKSGPGCFPVGMTLGLQDIQSTAGGETKAAAANRAINELWLEGARGDDFIGVQSYSRMLFGPNGPLPPPADAEVTQLGYEFYPEALEATIRHAIAVSGAPVIVTENGLGSADDTRRVEFIRRALNGVANCLRDGLDVRGYVHWSAFDNYEWIYGFEPKFGLIEVDRTTQTRTLKPSARYFGEIARTGIVP
jgi:beta-glucosidase